MSTHEERAREITGGCLYDEPCGRLRDRARWCDNCSLGETIEDALAAAERAALERAEAICHDKGDLCTENTARYERPEMVKVWASAAGAFYEAAGEIRALITPAKEADDDEK